MSKLYRHNAPFKLESGEVLPSLEIAYDTFGELNEAKDNVIWVCHALTANSDVADSLVIGLLTVPKYSFVSGFDII